MNWLKNCCVIVHITLSDGICRVSCIQLKWDRVSDDKNEIIWIHQKHIKRMICTIKIFRNLIWDSVGHEAFLSCHLNSEDSKRKMWFEWNKLNRVFVRCRSDRSSRQIFNAVWMWIVCSDFEYGAHFRIALNRKRRTD